VCKIYVSYVFIYKIAGCEQPLTRVYVSYVFTCKIAGWHG